jgi:hypothetical protein
VSCPICREESGHLKGFACRDVPGPVVRAAAKSIPRTRICESCAANLSSQPHEDWCPDIVKVARIATDDAGRRMEDALEAANIAGQAWLRARARRAA